MFCNQCGHENADDAKFCSKCGKPLSIANPNEPKQPSKKVDQTDIPKTKESVDGASFFSKEFTSGTEGKSPASKNQRLPTDRVLAGLAGLWIWVTVFSNPAGQFKNLTGLAYLAAYAFISIICVGGGYGVFLLILEKINNRIEKRSLRRTMLKTGIMVALLVTTILIMATMDGYIF